MKQSQNAICRPKGFKAQACGCGLKKNKRLDLALVFSEVPAVSCGMFTRNTFAAAAVIVSKEHLGTAKAQAIVANSGNANCYTGEQGLEVARKTAHRCAELLGIKDTLVLVASTGIIGRPVNFSKIQKALPLLSNSLERKAGQKVSRAIMTTDTQPKEAVACFKIGRAVVTIGATAKGAGMIAPDMATMLCFITTDAAIHYAALKIALREAVENSFNLITIDGCMSTNDSVLLLANGLAGNKIITKGSGGYLQFKAALKKVCLALAKMIVEDAEGATKFITIEVSGAKHNAEAKKAALAIANSNLFKTAVYGGGTNWGRIIAAIGASGITVKSKVALSCSSFKKRRVVVKVDLACGAGKAVVYTSDLTPEYVKINAEYN